MSLTVRKLLEFFAIFFLVFANVPGFSPGGDIKNTWLLVVPVFWFLYKRSVGERLWLYGAILIASSWALVSFSFKYILIFFLPLFIIVLAPSVSAYRYIVWIVCILTYFFTLLFLFEFSGFNFIFELIFGTGSGVSSTGYRGQSLFATEPSHLAPFLILLLDYSIRNAKGLARLLFLFAFLLGFIIGSSGSVFLYMAVYLSVLLISYLKLSSRHALNIAAVLIIMYIVFSSNMLPERLMNLSRAVLDSSGPSIESIESTARFASGRFISNYIWIGSAFVEPFGHGFDLNKLQAVSLANHYGVDLRVIGAYSRTGLYDLPIMPRSYLSFLTGVFGVLGFLFFILIVYLYKISRKIVNPPLFAVGLFYLLVVGFAGSPFPWLAFLISTRLIKK